MPIFIAAIAELPSVWNPFRFPNRTFLKDIRPTKYRILSRVFARNVRINDSNLLIPDPTPVGSDISNAE